MVLVRKNGKLARDKLAPFTMTAGVLEWDDLQKIESKPRKVGLDH
jgi:hypothetical protein